MVSPGPVVRMRQNGPVEGNGGKRTDDRMTGPKLISYA